MITDQNPKDKTLPLIYAEGTNSLNRGLIPCICVYQPQRFGLGARDLLSVEPGEYSFIVAGL